MSRFGDFVRSRPVLSALVASAVVVAGVSAVSAQYGQGGGWHRGGPGGWNRMARMERMCGMETARWAPVARAWVKADLALTPAQATEFDKLADVAQPAMDQIKGEVCGNFGPSAPKVAAPERLEKLAQTTRKAADALDKLVAPAKAFYASLDDKQKARVEEVLSRRRGGRGMMRGDGDGRGWHRGGPGSGQWGRQWGGPADPSGPFGDRAPNQQ
ncbi:MAG: Spy/CpxP family protein refolding chaperone [Proteobacteria bacterium]|nr:Spy/CpxP family protein refolding chaperone [Pseudomonadota bacterium]